MVGFDACLIWFVVICCALGFWFGFWGFVGFADCKLFVFELCTGAWLLVYLLIAVGLLGWCFAIVDLLYLCCVLFAVW